MTVLAEKGEILSLRFLSNLIFFICLPSFLFAEGIQGLTEENFGERFYGVYLGEFKLGYVIHEVSQTEQTVTQDFSMNMRKILSEEEQTEHKAKYAFSQIISRYQFDKKTGLLNEMIVADGQKYYANYDTLLKNNHIKGEISTLTAKYKGDFFYEVLTNDKDGETSKLLKLPKLHMNDYFAEINFISSKPEIGETRSIEIFDLDFEKEVFLGVTLTLKQKIRSSGGDYEYVIQEEVDDETFTYTVDRYGNIIGAKMFGLNLILEQKEKAITLDSKNI